MFRCFFKCAEKCSHGFWYCCDHLGLQWVPPWQAPWFPRHSQDWIIVLLEAPLAWKHSKNPCGMANQTLCWKIVQFFFPTSLCGVLVFRFAPAAFASARPAASQLITTSLITSQHHLSHHSTAHHTITPQLITTHHSTTYHTSLITAHHHTAALSQLTHHSTTHHHTAAQHNSSHHLWQHNSSSHSCTAHTAALHNSSHHLWQHNSSSHSWLSCGRRSTQSLLQELLRAWPPLGRGWLSPTPFQRRSLPPLRKKTPPLPLNTPPPPFFFLSGGGDWATGFVKDPPLWRPPPSLPYRCGLHSTLYTPPSTLYTLHSTRHTRHFTLHFALHIYTPYFTLHNPHFILYTLHFPVNAPLFILYSSHSTLCTPPHSTLHSLHWYGKNVQDCWNMLFLNSVLRGCIRAGWLIFHETFIQWSGFSWIFMDFPCKMFDCPRGNKTQQLDLRIWPRHGRRARDELPAMRSLDPPVLGKCKGPQADGNWWDQEKTGSWRSKISKMQDRKGDHCLRYRISYNVTYEYDITCRLQWVLKTDGQKRMDVAFKRVFSRDNEAFGYFFLVQLSRICSHFF